MTSRYISQPVVAVRKLGSLVYVVLEDLNGEKIDVRLEELKRTKGVLVNHEHCDDLASIEEGDIVSVPIRSKQNG